MIARFAGATLGLLAFTVTAAAGVIVRNPVDVTLSRSVLALFIFCVIGLILGSAAQMAISEHERKQRSEIRNRYHENPAGKDGVGPEEGAGGGEPESTAT